jgi:tellurite resistance protein
MRHRPFLEAAMAGAALVATADGEVSFSERMRMDRLLEELESLRVHDVHAAVDLFNDFVTALDDDRDLGRAKVFTAVRRIAGDTEAGKLLLKVCHLISEADGTVDPRERRAIEDLADCLGLTPPEPA